MAGMAVHGEAVQGEFFTVWRGSAGKARCCTVSGGEVCQGTVRPGTAGVAWNHQLQMKER